MNRTSKAMIVACAGALAFGSASQAQGAPEAAVLGNCGATKIHFAGSKKDGTHPTGSYKAIPEATVSFSTTATGCVIVYFSALAFADNATLMVRALLDGNPGTPTEIQFAANTPGPSFSHSVSFVFVNVPAGSHKVVMQHRKIGAGDAATHEHNTIVHHQ